MAAPDLTVTVEPFEKDSVVCAPLAPRTAWDDPTAQLSLVLTLTNNSESWLALSNVTITFASPPQVAPRSINVVKSLGPKETSHWYFTAPDNVILPVPTPGALTINVFCYDFDSPATFGFPLALYESSLAGGYSFPATSGDLKGGELWQGRSAAHAPAGGGVQLFAYDMDVVAFDGATSAWSALVPGGSASKNEEYRIWGKPVVAMADGFVVDFANDQPTNPNPPADLSPPNPVEGNHFYIQHGSDLVLYAHMQPGSLNPDLLVENQTVTAGTFLGLAGNSGNSTNPHLHIHAIKGTAPWRARPGRSSLRTSTSSTARC
jgi:Peptidase family M23